MSEGNEASGSAGDIRLSWLDQPIADESYRDEDPDAGASALRPELPGRLEGLQRICDGTRTALDGLAVVGRGLELFDEGAELHDADWILLYQARERIEALQRKWSSPAIEHQVIAEDQAMEREEAEEAGSDGKSSR